MIFEKLMATDEEKNTVFLFPEPCFHIYNEIWNRVSFMLPFFAYVEADIFHTSAFFGAEFYMDQILSNLATD